MTTVPQLRAARALLGWSQDELAAHSGVSKPTIARLELGTGDLAGYAKTRDKVIGALESAGVSFLADGVAVDGGPGVRLKKARDARQATEAQMQANAADVRVQAAAAVDEAMSGIDATRQEKAARRGALTDEPAVIAKARGNKQS